MTTRSKVAILWPFFADAWYRRIGWQRTLRPEYNRFPGGWTFTWAFLFVGRFRHGQG